MDIISYITIYSVAFSTFIVINSVEISNTSIWTMIDRANEISARAQIYFCYYFLKEFLVS